MSNKLQLDVGTKAGMLLFAGKTVWSTPEHLEGEVLTGKVLLSADLNLYKCLSTSRVRCSLERCYYPLTLTFIMSISCSPYLANHVIWNVCCLLVRICQWQFVGGRWFGYSGTSRSMCWHVRGSFCVVVHSDERISTYYCLHCTYMHFIGDGGCRL